MQVHRIAVHVVDQHFYRMESLLLLSNHLVTSFRLEMNFGSFSEHQNKTSDTDRYKRYFFTTSVSQVIVNTMKRIFEQWSELQVAKCLIVHALSSSYNVSSLELGKKGSNAATELSCRQQFCTQSGPCISIESVCGKCRK